ncbi:MAG TPA: hypothetical protein VK539_39790 [Myxococcaceae bacterium]|nr:hypothetical protein [Myxococcaceae bacterium]
MSHGHRQRGPIGRVSGLTRVESADTISRVRAAEPISRAATIESRVPRQRTFSEALERNERGLGRAEPLVPSEAGRRPLPPPVRAREELPGLPERLPDTFLGLLWLKMKGPR